MKEVGEGAHERKLQQAGYRSSELGEAWGQGQTSLLPTLLDTWERVHSLEP